MSDISIEAGNNIFQEGDAADGIYVIREGEVEISKHKKSGDVHISTLGAGDIFGEEVLISQESVRSITAKAKSSVICDVIGNAELDGLLGQCPPRFVPVIMMMLNKLRLKDSKRKKSKVDEEQVSSTLEIDVEKIIATSLSEPPLFEVLEFPVVRLPLAIGGYETKNGMSNKHKQNAINIACDQSPAVVSFRQCQVEIVDGALYVRDLGSRFTTTVNGKQIGRGKGVYIAPLEKGENILQLGGKDSTVMVKIECL